MIMTGSLVFFFYFAVLVRFFKFANLKQQLKHANSLKIFKIKRNHNYFLQRAFMDDYRKRHSLPAIDGVVTSGRHWWPALASNKALAHAFDRLDVHIENG